MDGRDPLTRPHRHARNHGGHVQASWGVLERPSVADRRRDNAHSGDASTEVGFDQRAAGRDGARPDIDCPPA